MSFSKEELIHYSRHLAISEFGESAQKNLKESSVLLVGIGGLGSPALLYLAAAGVGKIGIIDFDHIEASNLQRQVIYGYSDLGKSKAQVAAARAREMNPFIKIQCFEARFDLQNATELISDYDLVLDGADNFSTRYLINDVCALAKKPLISASVLGFEGQLYIFNLPGGPCYRCLYPEPPPAGTVPSCSEAGVLGVLPGIMGLFQATEAIKFLAKVGVVDPLVMKVYDGLNLSLMDFRIYRNKNCPLCGDQPSIRELKLENFECSLDGHPTLTKVLDISAVELKELIKLNTNLVLIDVREDFELEICKIQNSTQIVLNEFMAKSEAELLQSWDLQKSVVFYCRSGARSAKAAQKMMDSGFMNVKNLAGGILSWIEQIEPNLRRY